MVSFGIGCTNASFPGVYTAIAHYYWWIRLNEEPEPLTTVEQTTLSEASTEQVITEQGSTTEQGSNDQRSTTEKQTTTSRGTFVLLHIGTIVTLLVLLITCK